MDKHEHFDELKLLARKEAFCGYRFCPLCGQPMVIREVDGRKRMACADTACGFVHYQNPVPAAGAFIVRNDEVLMVKRAHPPRVGWWCFPAGFMEWQEHPEQTAIREVAEETGLQVRLTSFLNVYVGTDDPRTNAVLILYLAEVIGGELRAADDALEVRFFGFNELPENIAFESHRRALEDYSQRFRPSRDA
ncbi:MAG TPA: NUDIX hydrolase [Candidatus Deferrimicrobium sp.]|nr:NUDIX hydrolase [Candidatus Deferrimicrobium sp.]